MVGEHRIIAFGNGEMPEAQVAADDTRSATDSVSLDDGADLADSSDSGEPAGLTYRPWAAPAAAGVAVAAWTGLFLAARLPSFSPGLALARVPTLVVEWTVPVLLIGVAWLLFMRHSAREGRRFGDVARALSVESARMETRLTAVNRELSLAREFIAAQSRDLETLGRLAAERLSQNADRLQELVRENGTRVESISTVSAAALENMEKLRGQLPVIASSAKDVTNNIANAGRTAHGNLEDMIHGFNRLNEFGSASTRQVTMLREQVNETLEGFIARCDQLGALADGRFAALRARGEEFRSQLEKHEVEALAAIRVRAKALGEEIDKTRRQLDHNEAESLTSLRARLVALRDESDVVTRAFSQAEERATETLRASLANLSEEQTAAGVAIAEAHQSAIDALCERLAAISTEACQIDEAIGLRAERLAMEAQDRQSRQVEQERHAIARIDHMLGDLDASIAERLERHRIQAAMLAERASEVTGELGRFEARMETIAAQAGEAEGRLNSSLSTLTDALAAARTTLAVTDEEVEKLAEDSVRLLELLQASARQTNHALPEALALSEDRLRHLQETMSVVLTQLQQAARGGEEVTAEIGNSGRDLDALITSVSHAHADISARAEDHAALLVRLQESVSEIDAATQEAADRAGGALIAALAALGTTLDDAVSSIEDDSAERINRVAENLANDSAAAIDRAMRAKAAEVSGQLEQAVAHASGVTREAAAQLREQLEKVDELVGNLEGRVAEARERAEEQVDNDFARRAAVITDSLKSNAIDIATVLSSDIADDAWAAYLRGDRGIFTRRAVSLLDAGEAKAIQQIFERDDAFRANVSRYIHDFEGILRQVLSTRDGNALGVTLLSSDLGKLYVALAQGIERLRS